MSAGTNVAFGLGKAGSPGEHAEAGEAEDGPPIHEGRPERVTCDDSGQPGDPSFARVSSDDAPSLELDAEIEAPAEDSFENLRHFDDQKSLFTVTMGLVGGKKAPDEPDPNAAPLSKAGKVWGKIKKARTKVIKYITEEDDQERAKILKALVDDYKLHGRLSSDREIRVHYDSEIRRFLCPICGAKFVKEGNLMSHIELVEMASATDKASKIQDRRFGFENRSVKLAADIDMLYRSIRSSGQPMAHRVFSHNVHSDTLEEELLRATGGADRRQRSAHRLRRQSPFAIPLNARNPGRDIDDEDENEEIDRRLKELRPRRRRRGSPLAPQLGRTPSNASNASVTPSLCLSSPTPSSSSPDHFSRGNDVWRRPRAVVPHALPRSASNASIANSETSSASARPFTAPDTGFAGKRWIFDEISEEGFDHITPVADQHQTPHWKFYLPAYLQKAGNVSLRRQMLKANSGGFTKTSYVSIREKTPDLFADTIAGRVEPSQEQGKTGDRWLPYDPPDTTSQAAARITCTVRPLSRQESHANALSMELRNYQHVLEWIGLDIDAQGLDGGESGEGGAGEVDLGEAIPSSVPQYFASKPALAGPGGAQALHATFRTHEYYRRHVVDKRRVPGSNSSRAQTARPVKPAVRKSIGFRHLL